MKFKLYIKIYWNIRKEKYKFAMLTIKKIYYLKRKKKSCI